MTAQTFDLWYDTEPLNTMIRDPEGRLSRAVEEWEGGNPEGAATIARGLAGDIKGLHPRMPWRAAYALARFMVENTADARREAREEVTR